VKVIGLIPAFNCHLPRQTNHATQSSIPAPVLHETNEEGCALAVDHLHTAAEKSRSKVEDRRHNRPCSQHKRRPRELPGICRLVVASGALAITTARSAPRSNSAGQTRLPTFDEQQVDVRQRPFARRSADIGASRWQLPRC